MKNTKNNQLSDEQILEIISNEKIAVYNNFQLQMKDSIFQEMILKIWEALFISTNPAGKNNTLNFIKSFNSTVYENFEKSFDENYKLYCSNNEFAISKSDYRENFYAAIQNNADDLIKYFDLDKKIIIPT